MKDIIKEVVRAILPDEDRKYADVSAVSYEDFTEGRPGKTWWIGSRYLRLWFRKVIIYDIHFRSLNIKTKCSLKYMSNFGMCMI